MFVEDFIIDAYSIQLREEVRQNQKICLISNFTQVVPAFWRYFSTPASTKEEQVEVNGFQQFCKAVAHLYAAAMAFNPGLEELTRLRTRTGTARNLYGETEIPGLFRLHLAGSLHAQLPTTWQHLVSAFYGRAFAVFYHRVEAGGEVSLDNNTEKHFYMLPLGGLGGQCRLVWGLDLQRL